MNSFIKKHLTAALITSFSFILLTWFAYFNEYSEGGADTYWHYFYSRYAFSYPHLFFHHWGKPLFILLSSPFSCAGNFLGLQLFNITCGILSAIITYRFANELKLGSTALVIMILVYGPLYFIIIQSGLTEPLMALILIYSFYLLYKEKWVLATLVVSFTMFARSEGFVLIIYVFFYLALVRKWKYVPLLSTGFFVYAIAGVLAGHEFFWFFTENPYPVKSPYGSGSWLHFINKAEGVWGVPQLIFFTIGIGIISYKTFLTFGKLLSGKPSEIQKFFLLVGMPAGIFFIFHVVAWKFGIFGSLGLERVMASIAPLVALISFYGLHQLLIKYTHGKWTHLICFLFIVITLFYTFKFHHYPLKATGEHKVELEISGWFRSQNIPFRSVIYYAHPFIVFHTNRDPFDKNLNREQFGFDLDDLPHKDPVYIFWDSRFSKFSCGLKLDDLYASDRLQTVQETEDNGFKVVVFKLKT